MKRRRSYFIMKKKILLTFIISIAIILIIGRFVLIHMLNKRYHDAKTSFSNSQIILIAEKLNIDSNKITIHEMKYAHSQDKIFTFDISLDNIDAIENNYTYIGESEKKSLYTNKSNSNISCKILKEKSEYKGEFRVDEYDKELEELIRN